MCLQVVSAFFIFKHRRTGIKQDQSAEESLIEGLCAEVCELHRDAETRGNEASRDHYQLGKYYQRRKSILNTVHPSESS